MLRRLHPVEWPTVGVIAATTAAWMLTTWLSGHFGLWPLLGLSALCVTLHSSCQHEVLHGHPTRNRRLNELMVLPAVGLFFPFRRFMTLHLKHHNDPHLTDPYEDPETNYMAAADWDRLPAPIQWVRTVNNTLLGRLIIGPLIAVPGFWLADAKLIIHGDQRVQKAWALHALGMAMVLWWVIVVCGIGFWTYLFAVAYPGFSILGLRTFLEHRAEEAVPHRTCIVEDSSGAFGFLFLNNNLHLVHHSLPKVPWYELPHRYAEAKSSYLAMNGGYSFPSYWAMAARYLFRTKAELPHPFLRANDGK